MRMPRRAPTRRVRANTTTPAAPMPYEERAWHLAHQRSSRVPRTSEIHRLLELAATEIAAEGDVRAQGLERDCKRERRQVRWPARPQRMALLFHPGGGAAPHRSRSWGSPKQYRKTRSSLAGKATGQNFAPQQTGTANEGWHRRSRDIGRGLSDEQPLSTPGGYWRDIRTRLREAREQNPKPAVCEMHPLPKQRGRPEWPSC